MIEFTFQYWCKLEHVENNYVDDKTPPDYCHNMEIQNEIKGWNSFRMPSLV